MQEICQQPPSRGNSEQVFTFYCKLSCPITCSRASFLRMNRFIVALCVSLIIHGIGALSLSLFRYAADPPKKDIEILLMQPSEQSSPVMVPLTASAPTPALPHDSGVALPPMETNDELSVVPAIEPAVVDSTDTMNRFEFFTQNSALPSFTVSSADSHRSVDVSGKISSVFNKTKNQPLSLKRPGLFDKTQMEIDKHNLGGERPISLSDAVRAGGEYLSKLQQKKENEKPVRLDFIPSRTELEILSAVWQKPKVNDVEIYASMDSSIRVTAEELQHILEGLVQKKLLTRNLTSPRNEFTLPFGGTVEMSAKNRRNRVYEYQARIEADEVIRYLNALLYELEHGAGPRTPVYQKRIADLKEKILLTGR